MVALFCLGTAGSSARAIIPELVLGGTAGQWAKIAA
jgi:hypothetical protein